MHVSCCTFALLNPEDVFSANSLVGIVASLILDPSRRANNKRSSLISEESGFLH